MSRQSTAPTDLDRRQARAARFQLGISVAIGLLAWLGIWLQMMFFAPRTEALLLSANMKIPWVTEMVMRQFWWMLPAVFVIAFLGCLGLRKRLAWNFSLIVLPLLLNVIVLVSLYIPTMQLAIFMQELLAANG